LWSWFFFAVNHGWGVMLIEDSSSTNLRGIHFQFKLSTWIWSYENRGIGDECDNLFLCILLFWPLFKWHSFSSKVCNQCCKL
jgi:hypothetical protein